MSKSRNLIEYSPVGIRNTDTRMNRFKSRMKYSIFLLALLVPLVTMVATFNHSHAASQPAEGSKSKGAPTRVAGFATLPLSFEANEGQADSKAKFIAHGGGYTVVLTGDKAQLSLQKRSTSTQNSKLRPTVDVHKPTTNEDSLSSEFVSMKLIGASREGTVTGLNELPGKSNYFIGNDAKNWHVNVPNFAKVKYEHIYRGIDLVYYGNQQQLEYDFVVAPGADPKSIQLSFESSSANEKQRPLRSVRVGANGDLVIHTSSGEVRMLKPVVYQSSGTNRQFVDGRFIRLPQNRFGFEVASYDKTRPLVIDPILSFGSYLGATGVLSARGIAVDSFGNSYVAGSTCDPIFLGSNCHATVSKINSTGNALVYSTVIGGSLVDAANGITVDSSGNAYVTGQTSSPDFPTTTGAFQNTLRGQADAFITKLDINGKQLYSTYLGGNESPQASGDSGFGIAVDSSGKVYVAGDTCTGDFPTKNGFRSKNENCEGFAAKFNPVGAGPADLLYSTLLGGDDQVDSIHTIAVDPQNFVYVAGLSTGNNFPTTEGAFQRDNVNFSDAVMAKLDMTKSGSDSLLYGTYLGGRQLDFASSIAVDSKGDVYVAGTTESADFPTTAGAFQGTRLPDTDDPSQAIESGFLAKIRPAGKGKDDLLYSTFFGGNSSQPHAKEGENVFAIAVGSTGNIYFTGDTCSKDFPVTSDAFQTSFAGPELAGNNRCEAFVAKLNPVGGGTSDLVFATYLGGSGEDSGRGIALDSNGNAHVVGITSSTDFPHTRDALGTTFGGTSFGFDAFAAAIPIGNFSIDSVSAITADVGGSGTASVTVNAINEFTAPITLSVSGPSTVTASFNPSPLTPLPGTSASSVMTVTPGVATTPGTFTLNVTGTSGLLSHSTSTQLTVRASASGTSDVIDDITAAGCIDNSGISGALINKLKDAQAFIDAGQIQNGVNTLSALLNQLQAQGEKHISSTCTVNGQTFNPIDVLITDVRAILAGLKAPSPPNPIVGFVVNSSNVGIAGATVSILNTANTATTDATGFYFFANTGSLPVGNSFTAKVTGFPAGFKSSSPASQSFTFQGNTITLGNFALSKK